MGLPIVEVMMMCWDSPSPFFSARKCNPPKCKVHDFLKIFQTQHGLHFSWEHS